MEASKEVGLDGYPKIINYECHQKIMEQMEKNICRINIGEEKGTGFFCKIPFPDRNNMLPVFVTNNHVIDEKLLYKENARISIKIKGDKKSKELNLNNRIKYTNKKYDITIIEIKERDGIKDYLELDDKIINDIINNINENEEYIGKTIYIIQYPEGELSVSYGVIQSIYLDIQYNFVHKCSTRRGSSGSPILNLKNKIIGIHKEGTNQYNIGSFMNYSLKDFVKINVDNNLNQNFLKLAKIGDKEKFLEIYKHFLSIKKNININYKDENGNTALHYACDKGNLKIVEILLDSNCDTNIKNINKQTPLYLSAKRGYFDISKKLIESGAEINLEDSEKN